MRFADAPARKAAARRRGPARALLASLLVHGLLLSLAFGGDGAGLPGLNLPWQQRRAEAPDLRVLLVPAAPEPSRPPPPALPVAPDAPEATPDTPARSDSATDAPARAEPTPVAEAAPLRMEGAEAIAATAPAVIAVDRPARPTWTVPPALPASTPVIAVFGQDAASAPPAMAPLRNASDAMRMRADRERAADLARLDLSGEDVRQQAQRLEAARAEAERLEAARTAAQQEATRQEAAQRNAARAEADRQDAARRDAAQQAAARQEALRQDTARQEAARAEAARQEAARQEAARQEAARQDAAKQEAARQDAARAEAARQEASRVATAKLDAARAAEEQREARLRAIGRQLDEEAARRDAAASRPPNAALPTSWSSARRGRLLGRIDTNAELVAYAEAWARKIQFNPTFDTVRDALKQPYTDPLVNVAIRSDGSVESVTFVRSSGVPALDDAIRRVIQSQERYAAFPPALLQDYDVIEIRRTWHFDSAIRLY